jgi:polyhydroxyalkanoate synthesis repressor PhaR
MLPNRQARTGLLMATSLEPITIKRYAEGRLYNPAAGHYLTLDELGLMVEDDEEFVVYDAHTGANITPTVLKQIILERARHG